MRNNGIQLVKTFTTGRTSAPAIQSALSRLGPISSRRSIPTVSHRTIHTTPRLQSGGLTNLFDVEDQGARPRLAVHKLNDEGFHLSDGLVIPGGVIFLENRAFLWDVDPVGTDELSGRGKWKEEGWSKDRFKIFETVVPRPGKYRRTRYAPSRGMFDLFSALFVPSFKKSCCLVPANPLYHLRQTFENISPV